MYQEIVTINVDSMFKLCGQVAFSQLTVVKLEYCIGIKPSFNRTPATLLFY